MNSVVASVVSFMLVASQAPAPAPSQGQAPPPQQGWGPAPAQTSQQPQPGPAPQPAPGWDAPQNPPAAQQPAPQPQPPIDRARHRTGVALLAPGASMLAVGLATMIFVGGISGAIRDGAMADAANSDSREDEVRALNTARGADRTMNIGIWVGVGLVTVGLPLTIAGAVLKSQAKSGVAKRIDLRGNGMAVRF